MRTELRDPDAKKPWPLWVWGTLTVLGAVSLFCCLPIGWNLYSEMSFVEDADSEALEAAATAFGRRGDTLRCEEESLARLDRCASEAKTLRRTDQKQAHHKQCLIEILHFHRHCLEAAKPTPQFCGRLNGRDAQAGMKLQSDVCSARYSTFEAPGCRQIVQQSWAYCAKAQ